MGAEVSFLTAIGDDAFGLECEKIAEKNRLNAKLVKKKDKKTAVAYILIDKNGENQVTEYQDAFLDENDVLGFEDEIAKSDILLLQQETSLEVNETAIKLTK